MLNRSINEATGKGRTPSSSDRWPADKVTTESLSSLLSCNQLILLPILLVAGVFYFFFSPLLLLIGFLISRRRPLPEIGNHLCQNDTRSHGIISQRVCPKTGRTYVSRFIDTERDTVDAARLISSVFGTGQYTKTLQPEIGPRHTFGHLWHQYLMDSPSYDVIVEEWPEEERLIGVMVYSKRRRTQLQDFIDNSKMMAVAFQYLFINPRTSYMMVRMQFAMALKFRQLSKMSKLTNPLILKLLGVEKDFQGQGVGSGLLKILLRHADNLCYDIYLESPDPRNVSLYERHDFELLERWKFHPTSENLHLMIRTHRRRNDMIQDGSMEDGQTKDPMNGGSAEKTTSSHRSETGPSLRPSQRSLHCV